MRIKNMFKRTSILYVVPAVIIATLLVTTLIFAWTEPSTSPPGANISAPVNIGTSTQYKSGALGVGGVFRGYSTGIFDGNVGIGTPVPSSKLDIVDSATLGRIRVSGVSTGYTQADILLQTGTTDAPAARGTGIYTQNQGNNTTWYFGNPYGSSDFFAINRKSGTGLLVETAQSNATGVSNFVTINNSGNVGIGTTNPGKIKCASAFRNKLHS